MKTLNILIAGTLLSLVNLHAIADVPNNFISGTKAKASEVNENFSYLDSKITSIEESIMQSSGGNNGQPTYTCPTKNGDYPYTYDFIDAPLGSALYLGGVEYRTVKYAVNDKLGNTYHITMPARVSIQTSPTSTSYVTLRPSAFDVESDYICEDGEAFGDGIFVWNKITGITINSTLNYSNDGDDDSSLYYDTSITETLTFNASISTGNVYTNLFISVNAGSNVELVDNGDYDFTDNIPSNGNIDHSNAIAELTTYLNHIRIEKISQP